MNRRESVIIARLLTVMIAFVIVLYFPAYVYAADNLFDDMVVGERAKTDDEAISNDNYDSIFVEKASIHEKMNISDQIIQAGGFPKRSNIATDDEIHRYAVSEYPDKNIYIEASEKVASAFKAWDGLSDRISIDVSSYKIPVNQRMTFVSAVINNLPECFIFKNTFWYTPDDTSNYIKDIIFSVDTSYDRKDVDEFYGVADRIIASADPSWTDLQKIVYVHDYLVMHTDYDLTYTKYNAYNAIVEGNAVCQGYALAYAYLLNRINKSFDCRIVTSEELNHAWNMITLNGSRYYIDVTWDDPIGQYKLYNSYCNFLVSQDKLRSNHNSIDWLDAYGDLIYGKVNTAETYDAAPWSQMHSCIPMVGNTGFYYQGYSPIKLYAYDFTNGKSDQVASYDGVWKTWNGSGSWVGCYSSLVRHGDDIVITLPQKILLITKDGEIIKSYDPESKDGDIYGAYMDGNTLIYDIYTAPQPPKGTYIGRYQLLLKDENPVKGDLTGDGNVAMNDVVKLARAVAGSVKLTEKEKKLGDVTGDGGIAMNDVVKLAQYVSKTIHEL